MIKREENFQTAVIHRSLTRPQLIAGCDRELFIIVVLFAVLLVIPGGIMSGSLFNIIFGICLFLAGISALSWVAKKDSSMRLIFIRSVKYKDIYPARSTVKAITYRRFDANWL